MVKTMRMREAAIALGISLPNLRQKARTDPDFPTLIMLGPKSTVIRESDLEKYLERKSKPRVGAAAEQAQDVQITLQGLPAGTRATPCKVDVSEAVPR